MMDASEIAFALTCACPDCAQQPPDPCKDFDSHEVMALPHSSRYEAALFCQAVTAGVNASDTGKLQELEAETHPLTDELIERTGLFE